MGPLSEEATDLLNDNVNLLRKRCNRYNCGISRLLNQEASWLREDMANVLAEEVDLEDVADL
jgi:hypothetical protein